MPWKVDQKCPEKQDKKSKTDMKNIDSALVTLIVLKNLFEKNYFLKNFANYDIFFRIGSPFSGSRISKLDATTEYRLHWPHWPRMYGYSHKRGFWGHYKIRGHINQPSSKIQEGSNIRKSIPVLLRNIILESNFL